MSVCIHVYLMYTFVCRGVCFLLKGIWKRYRVWVVFFGLVSRQEDLVESAYKGLVR